MEVLVYKTSAEANSWDAPTARGRYRRCRRAAKQDLMIAIADFEVERIFPSFTKTGACS